MKIVLAGLCLAAVANASAAHADQSLSAILTRMDEAAPGFHSLSANVEMVEFQAILQDKTTDEGKLEMQRKGKNVRAILTFPDRVIGFLGNLVQIYFPNANTVQSYATKNSNVLNQFLLLGFGSSGKELAQSYTITVDGTEKIAEHDTTRLTLEPKDAKIQERLSKIDVWIPVDGANPIQQQFFEPSGNWRQVKYSNIVLNPPLTGNLEMKLPAGVKK